MVNKTSHKKIETFSRIYPSKNLYRVLVEASGMSHSDLADLHQVSKAAVASWLYGASNVPAARVEELSKMVDMMTEHKATLTKEIIKQLSEGQKIDFFRKFETNPAARIFGWPYASLHWRAVTNAIADLPHVYRAQLFEGSQSNKSQNV